MGTLLNNYFGGIFTPMPIILQKFPNFGQNAIFHCINLP
jgi:hypothetical protein